MMMKYISGSFLVLGLLILVSGCEEEDNSAEELEQENRFFDLYMSAHYPDITPTESGLYYEDIKVGDGQSPAKDDWVLVDYVTYAIPEESVLESYIENVVVDNGLVNTSTTPVLLGPVKIDLEYHVEGVREGLSRMKEGGQAVMCFTSELGFGSAGGTLMKSVSAYQSLKYEFELLKVIGDIEVWENERFASYVDTIEGAISIYDEETETTMYYVKTLEQPDSLQVIKDTALVVSYKGYLLDGRVFDESGDDAPLEFDYNDESTVIQGWILAMEKFREGEKGILYIPYKLAYGEEGKFTGGIMSIPPYEPLIFEIEIVDMVEEDSGEGGEV